MGWGLMVLELGMKSSSDDVLESSSWGGDDDDVVVVPSGTDPIVSAPVTAPLFSLAARRAWMILWRQVLESQIILCCKVRNQEHVDQRFMCVYE